MIDLSLEEGTYAALMMLRKVGETGDELIQRLLEYARCYMVIQGAESSDAVKDFVLSRRSDIEKDMENFGMLKPVLKYFLEEAPS